MANLYIDIGKIYNNARAVVNEAKKLNISITGVVKQCNADVKVAQAFVKAGCKSLAVSRVRHAKELKTAGINVPIWLIRVPAISELDEIVDFVDVVLISEEESIVRLNKICNAKNIVKKIILMYEIGDLREGFWPLESLLATIEKIKDLKNISIEGIGMNASCYGSVIPTEKNLSDLVKAGEAIEKIINKKLNIYSGGNTTSLTLIRQGNMPERINNLRVGESILLSRDLKYLWNSDIEGTVTDTFVVKAEVIEVKEKPSKPFGETFFDAFGKQPCFEDKGIRKRALVSIGRVDFLDEQGLVPLDEGIEILGSSTDYLILDIQDCEKDIKIGDWLEFEITFACMYSLCTSKDVKIIYKGEI